MKTLITIVMALFAGAALSGQSGKSFYDFKVNTLEGEPFDLSTLKGKKVLVVNTASKCGNTPQYEELEALYKEYGSKGFVIIGFPANNFLGQEPGSNEEIREFCTRNYGVTFPMMEKISVKGSDMHPLYQWLTKKANNGVIDAPVTWNFQKFMIDEKGNVIDSISPRTKPAKSEKLMTWIKGS